MREEAGRGAAPRRGPRPSPPSHFPDVSLRCPVPFESFEASGRFFFCLSLSLSLSVSLSLFFCLSLFFISGVQLGASVASSLSHFFFARIELGGSSAAVRAGVQLGVSVASSLSHFFSPRESSSEAPPWRRGRGFRNELDVLD